MSTHKKRCIIAGLAVSGYMFFFFILGSVFPPVSLSLEAREAVDAKAEEALVLSAEGWNRYYDKEFDKAIELFRKEESLHSDWCDPYDGLGWSYLQKGDFIKSEEYFKKSLKIYRYYQNSLVGLVEVNTWRYRPYNQAWAAYYAGNLDKAVEKFNAIISDNTGRLPEADVKFVYGALGWAYFGKKNYDMAIQKFKEAAALQKNNADIAKGLGLAYYEKGDLDNAFANLQESLRLFPQQPDVQSAIAWVHRKKGDNRKAIEEFERAKRLNPYLAEPYKGLGWAYLEQEDEKKAKENFIIGIKIYPGYVADEKLREEIRSKKEWSDLYSILGWSYYNYGLYKLSAEAFEGALKELGEDAAIQRGLGYAYYKLGEYDKAIGYLKKSFAGDPSLVPVDEYVQVPGTLAVFPIKGDAQSSLGWALYYKGDYANAVKAFEEALKRHPDWVDAHDGLGWARYMTKDYKNAEKSFKDALSFSPYYADAVNGIIAIDQVKYGKSGLGWTYYYRGDFKTALKQFEELVRDKSAEFPKEQLWSIHNGMGWCHYWLGNFIAAEKEFREVLGERKDNVDALVGLGYALFQRKNYVAAVTSLEESLKPAPANYTALTVLGWSYYKINDFTKAIDTFKRAIALNAYLVDPYLGLGLSYYRHNDLKEAKEALGIAIDIYPDYVMTDEVKEILEKQKDWADLYGRLGWSYYYKGIYNKASDMFSDLTKKDLSSKDALMGFGSIYFQQGDYKAAVNKLEPLLADKPAREKGWYKWSYVLRSLGWSWYYQGDYDKALNYFNQLASLHAEDDIYAEPYSGIGWALLKKGDKKEAQKQFLKAIKLAPGYVSALEGLAQVD